jgi:serine/threonine protein kinase
MSNYNRLEMANALVDMARVHTQNGNWPSPTKFLAGGVNGKVFETNNGKLVKIIYGKAPQEFTSLHKLQGTGLVPGFNKSHSAVIPLDDELSQVIGETLFPEAPKRSKHLTIFIMNKVGGNSSMTLHKYMTTYTHMYDSSQITDLIKRALQTLHSKGISHGDLHAGNIIVTVRPSDGKIDSLWIIDFGRSRRIQSGKTERNMISKRPPETMYGNIPLRRYSTGYHRANTDMARMYYGV